MRGTSRAEQGRGQSIRMDPGPRIAGMTEGGPWVGLLASAPAKRLCNPLHQLRLGLQEPAEIRCGDAADRHPAPWQVAWRIAC